MTASITVTANGSPISGTPHKVVVSNRLNQPDLVEVYYEDDARALFKGASNLRIGNKLKVEASLGGSEKEVLAEVEIIAFEAYFEGRIFYSVVRGLDASHRLQRGMWTQTWEDKTADEVVRDVASMCNLEVGEVDKTTVKFPYLTIANETAYDFLRMLGSASGAVPTVKDNKLHFKVPETPAGAPAPSSKDAQVLDLRNNVLALNAVLTSAQQVKKVEAHGWNPAEKKAVVGQADVTTKAVELKSGETADALAGKYDKGQVHVLASPTYEDQPTVDAVAKAAAERLASGFVEVHGVAEMNPKLRPGVPVTITNAGDTFDGKYTLSATTHVKDGEGYFTEFTVSGTQDRSLIGLTAAGAGGANGNGKGHAGGVVPAVVTDNSDKEHKGRVRLAFSWMGDKHVSGWARVAFPGAGNKRGFVSIPDVGDEVLVAFENGDVRHPVVVGGLFNGKDAFAEHKQKDHFDGKGHALYTHLHSDKHKFVLSDKQGEEAITLGFLDEAYTITLEKKGDTIKITSKGKVEVVADKDISIESKSGNVSITSKTGDVTITATGKLAASGKGGAEIGSTGQTKVSGSQISLG